MYPRSSVGGPFYLSCLLLRYIYLSVLLRSRVRSIGSCCRSLDSKRFLYYNYSRSLHLIPSLSSCFSISLVYQHHQASLARGNSFQNDDRSHKSWIERSDMRRRSHCLDVYRVCCSRPETIYKEYDRSQCRSRRLCRASCFRAVSRTYCSHLCRGAAWARYDLTTSSIQASPCLTPRLGRHNSSVSVEEMKQLNKVSLVEPFDMIYTDTCQGVMGQRSYLSSQLNLDQNLDPTSISTSLCWI